MDLSVDCCKGHQCFLFLICLIFLPPSAQAESGQFSLCGVKGRISYPSVNISPVTQSWSQGDIKSVQNSQSCTELILEDFPLYTELVASFNYEGNSTGLLKRFSDVSDMKGILYWSVTDKSWKTFITASAALDTLTRNKKRPNFVIEEMKTGNDLYYAQRDNRSSGEIIYRMHIHENTSDRILITTENVSSINFLMVTIVKPKDFQSVYLLEKISPGKWGYYSLSGIRKNHSMFAAQNKSYSNRAEAIYHYITVDKNLIHQE